MSEKWPEIMFAVSALRKVFGAEVTEEKRESFEAWLTWLYERYDDSEIATYYHKVVLHER